MRRRSASSRIPSRRGRSTGLACGGPPASRGSRAGCASPSPEAGSSTTTASLTACTGGPRTWAPRTSTPSSTGRGTSGTRAGDLSDSGLVVVEVARRGKLVVGEPFFVPGVPLVLDRKGLWEAGPGDLAVVRPGRGRARLERVLGPARSIEAALEGLLVERSLRQPFEPYDPPEP